MAKNNPFDKFSEAVEEKVTIESLGAEITLRKMTQEEKDTFSSMMVKGIKPNGDPEIDIQKAMEVKYRKIATLMVEPKMSEKQLKNLVDATAVIDEIIGYIDGKSDIKEDEEGN